MGVRGRVVVTILGLGAAVSVVAALIVTDVFSAQISSPEPDVRARPSAFEQGPPIPLPPKPEQPVTQRARCRGVAVSPDDDLVEVVGAHGESTTFCLDRGVHRVATPVQPSAGQKLIGRPGAVVSGAKVIDKWAESRPGVWTASGQTQESEPAGQNFPDLARPEARYNESVFLDGRALERVLDLDRLAPGRFYFDYESDEIHIADEPSGHLVEGSVATHVILGTADEIEIRDLTIEKSAGFGIEARGTEDWVISGNEIRFNHQIGVCSGPRSRVLDNHIHHQGQMGICGSGDGILVERNEIAFNNSAGFATADGQCWDAGGSKWVLTTKLVVRDNYVHDNYCHGLWTDIDNRRTTYEGNWIEDNRGTGLFHEISYEATVRDNVVRANRSVGIDIVSSPDVDVADNLVIDNGDGILIRQSNRGSGRFGPHVTNNITVRDNTVEMRHGLSGVLGLGEDGGGSLRFLRNSYRLTDPREGSFTLGGDPLDFDQWQAEGHDRRGQVYAR